MPPDKVEDCRRVTEPRRRWDLIHARAHSGAEKADHREAWLGRGGRLLEEMREQWRNKSDPISGQI